MPVCRYLHMSSGTDADRLDADPDMIFHFDACPDPATFYTYVRKESESMSWVAEFSSVV